MYKIKKRYKIFNNGVNKENMEIILQNYIEKANKLQVENEEIKKEIGFIDPDLLKLLVVN